METLSIWVSAMTSMLELDLVRKERLVMTKRVEKIANFNDSDSSESVVQDDPSFDVRAFYKTNDDWGWTRVSSSKAHTTKCVRPIWIDAICINQDEEEKINQISLMNQIYRRAETVWLWLGITEDQHWMQDAIDLLPMLASVTHHGKSPYEELDQGIFEENLQESLVRTIRQANDEIRRSLAHIICNEWFCRVWTLQEYVLAE